MKNNALDKQVVSYDNLLSYKKSLYLDINFTFSNIQWYTDTLNDGYGH